MLWDLGIFQKASHIVIQSDWFISRIQFLLLFYFSVSIGLHRHRSLFVLVVGGFISLGKRTVWCQGRNGSQGSLVTDVSLQTAVQQMHGCPQPCNVQLKHVRGMFSSMLYLPNLCLPFKRIRKTSQKSSWRLLPPKLGQCKRRYFTPCARWFSGLQVFYCQNP